MADLPRVVLKPKKEASLRRKHHWVFSGAIDKIEGAVQEGELVNVHDHNGQFLATGHFQKGSIQVRILSFSPTDAGSDFWQQKIGAAISWRDRLNILNEHTNACRLIHGEGDGLPGLIVDYYNGVAVLQAHSVGMYRQRALIVEALQSALGARLNAVYDRSKSVLNLREFPDAANGFLWGEAGNQVAIKESGHHFLVNVVEGQKTGFFLDQRENRRLLGQYAKGRKVLNAFAYTGGFSVYALGGGAESVTSVEISKPTVALLEEHIRMNGGETAAHTAQAADALRYLDHMAPNAFDLIILDPPAFAKHRGALDNALRGYRRINRSALERIAPGGILFTFSCSQVVSKKDFRHSVFTAAAQAGREVRILHRLDQPADHPINIYHPEGEYLKGLVLAVD